MDITPAATVVASVDADSLAEELFDGRFEARAAFGQIQACEGQVGGLQGAGQWADIVVVWSVDALLVDLFLPKCVGSQGLGDTIVCERGVGPGRCAIAV